MSQRSRPSRRVRPGPLTASALPGMGRAGFLFLALLSLPFCRCGLAEAEDPERRAAELESVRGQIRATEDNLSTARTQLLELNNALRETEQAVAGLAAEMQTLEGRIEENRLQLDRLEQEKAGYASRLTDEREYLKRQIRAAYRMGRDDYVKLLLNLEDADKMGRMLAYFDYYNRSRSTRIAAIGEAMAGLGQVETEIRSGAAKLEELRDRESRQLALLTQAKEARNGALAKLEGHIDAEGKRLQILRQDATELEALLARLRQPDSAVAMVEDLPPFGSLKGDLKWPVKGRIAERFGSLKKDGKLRHQGVTIAAEGGTEVHAVSPGKVVFADWFRNLGLLLIIDHGGGYMSLYGHNGRLLKKVGDRVAADEVIGSVGDTGGQTRPGLYFEIRLTGDPVDPALWCRG
ncbi:MAG TPA: peptidoglycan DD-metalloendopeptidase family protein [Gammaproteobacteria bacterium]|nr:peptidoglycan DD-metalloendopeptidase family protein [Gammaproteobacteria bacterium]